MASIGDYLKALRGKRSLREMERLTGLSHTYLSTLEKGFDPRSGKERKPTPETLKKISEALPEVKYSDLLFKAGYIASPILNLGDAIDRARSDWFNESNGKYFDEPLELISKKTNIPLEKLVLIQDGQYVNLSSEEIDLLSNALDVPFAALYLISTKESNYFEKDYVDGLVRRLFFISSSEANRMKDKNFEEFCNDYNEQQSKYNPFYIPDANELNQLYQEYQFVRFIDPLIRSFALSKEQTDTDSTGPVIKESPTINLKIKEDKTSKLDKTNL